MLKMKRWWTMIRKPQTSYKKLQTQQITSNDNQPAKKNTTKTPQEEGAQNTGNSTGESIYHLRSFRCRRFGLDEIQLKNDLEMLSMRIYETMLKEYNLL